MSAGTRLFVAAINIISKHFTFKPPAIVKNKQTKEEITGTSNNMDDSPKLKEE